MPETYNNCFGLKKCSTTLRQAKTGKHDCRNVTAILSSGPMRLSLWKISQEKLWKISEERLWNINSLNIMVLEF